MRIATWLIAVALMVTPCAETALAGDTPAAPKADGGTGVPGTGGTATGGGIKELPGTVKKDVGDAVKKDLGLGGKPAAKDADADMGDMEPEAADEEE